MTCKGWRNKYDIDDVNQNMELNGNISGLGKRKKSRTKKQCGYLQEWLDKSYSFQQHPVAHYGFEDEAIPKASKYRASPCWPTVPVVDRRLYPTLSEPAVCRYSALPLGYSLEPVSLPLYVPFPSSEQIPSPVVRKRSINRHTARPVGGNIHPSSRRDRGTLKVPQAHDVSNNEEFTSLPPVATSHTPDTIRRRFSDPGIRRTPELAYCKVDSSDSDTCSHVSSPPPVADNQLVLNLMEQVSSLQESNKRLTKELRETQAQLEVLKQHWNKSRSEYEPGALSEVIREIREATRIREEVFIKKICNVLEASGDNHGTNFSANLKKALMDQSIPLRTSNLGGMEEKFRQLNISRTETGSSSASAHGVEADERLKQMHELERERLQLKRELEEAIASRKDAESQAQKLEQLVGMLRKKINGVSIGEKIVSSEQSPSESLVSTASSSSTTHSPQVTMSGPVTDL